jgi:diguanylate cyclase (GGDEF)-like protein/PAS domain S-box-containing protein
MESNMKTAFLNILLTNYFSSPFLFFIVVFPAQFFHGGTEELYETGRYAQDKKYYQKPRGSPQEFIKEIPYRKPHEGGHNEVYAHLARVQELSHQGLGHFQNYTVKTGIFFIAIESSIIWKEVAFKERIAPRVPLESFLRKKLVLGYLASLAVFAAFVLVFYLMMETTARGAILILLIGGGLSLIVFSWIFFHLNREITERERAENETKRISHEYELRLKRAEVALKESEESFKSIYEKSPIGIELYNEQGGLIDANQASMDIFGVSGREKALGYNLFSDPNLPNITERLEAAEIVSIEITYDFDAIKKAVLYRTKKEGRIELSILFTPLVPESRKTPSGYLLQIQDITERKRALSELQKANQDLSGWLNELEQRNREIELLGRMTSLLQACSTAEEAYSVIGNLAAEIFSAESGTIYLLNASQNLLEPVSSWGGAAEQVFSPNECWGLRLGRTYVVEKPGTGMSCLHLEKEPEAGYLCVPMIAQGETIGMIHVEFSTYMLNLPDEAQERTRANKARLGEAVAESIALSLANFRLRETLFKQSIHDPLTGLFNRRYMSEFLKRELHRAGRRERPLSVIMLDLDHFKQINDSFGHDAGDMVLKEIGSFIERKIRGDDFACRYGGEEFLIILPETDIAIAGERAEELRKEVKELSLQYRGKRLDPITLSLGVAEFPRNGHNAEELLRAADSALYRAKAEGRDRVVSI